MIKTREEFINPIGNVKLVKFSNLILFKHLVTKSFESWAVACTGAAGRCGLGLGSKLVKGRASETFSEAGLRKGRGMEPFLNSRVHQTLKGVFNHLVVELVFPLEGRGRQPTNIQACTAPPPTPPL